VPGRKTGFVQYLDGVQALAPAWLKKYPLRTPAADDPGGLTEAIPWVMADGTELGHMRISDEPFVESCGEVGVVGHAVRRRQDTRIRSARAPCRVPIRTARA